MKALIVEDETLAADNLVKILMEIGSIEVITVLESVNETVEWFKQNKEPEILFLDIHLADGSAFEIFEKVDINCPIVFTTAYDEYALKAFKVNSIDYLLKPLEFNAVTNSLEKHKRLITPSHSSVNDLRNLIDYFKKQKPFKSNFLIPTKGDKLIPLNTDEVMYFFIDYGTVKAVTAESKSFTMDKTLDEISEMVDPRLFFRVNRQYIISRKAIKDMDLWFNQRLSLNLKVSVPEKIVISKARIPEFKTWFTTEN
jgi:two-component system LytT family response regulator